MRAQASRLPQAARGGWRLSWRELGMMEELRARPMFLCACVREWAGIFLLFLVARPGFGLGLRSTVCADLLSRCKVF